MFESPESRQASLLAVPALLLTLLLVLWPGERVAAADPPGILNYQGRIAADGTDFDGAGQFKFALVNRHGKCHLLVERRLQQHGRRTRYRGGG